MLTGEMSPREGLLAAQWLGLKTVLPCHYITPEATPTWPSSSACTPRRRSRGERVPECVVLKPGDWLELN